MDCVPGAWRWRWCAAWQGASELQTWSQNQADGRSSAAGYDSGQKGAGNGLTLEEWQNLTRKGITLNKRLLAVSSAVLLAFGFTSSSAQEGPTEPAYLYTAEVTNVVDGDTIDVDIDLGFYIMLKNQRIRLVGIDAPEKRGESRVAGKAATVFLRDLIDGKSIILKTKKGRDDADRSDSFGRWLGVVYLDGVDINQALIDAGHAVEDIRD